jgi:hypothetical protein
MFLDPETNNYIQWRMCPPGRCKFFFTVEGKQLISNKYPIANYHLRTKVFNNQFMLGHI